MTSPYGFRTEEELAIGYWLWAIATPVLVVFGIVGNAVSLLVLCRKKMFKTVSTTYLIAIAVVDSSTLLFNAMWIWIDQILEKDLEVGSGIICKITWYKSLVLPDISSWILVCINIERVMSTKANYRYKCICSRKSARIVLLITFTSVLLIDAIALFAFEINSITSANGTVVKICVTNNEYEWVYTIWPFIHLFKSVIIPMCIMMSVSIWILVKMVRLKYKCGVPAQSGEAVARRHWTIPSVSVLLFGMNAVFTFTNIPFIGYLIFDPFIATLEIPVFIKSREPVLAALTLLMYVNNAVNFLLYCFTGARFRAELRAMCGLGN